MSWGAKKSLSSSTAYRRNKSVFLNLKTEKSIFRIEYFTKQNFMFSEAIADLSVYSLHLVKFWFHPDSYFEYL
jgi:hypothetical protein